MAITPLVNRASARINAGSTVKNQGSDAGSAFRRVLSRTRQVRRPDAAPETAKSETSGPSVKSDEAKTLSSDQPSGESGTNTASKSAEKTSKAGPRQKSTRNVQMANSTQTAEAPTSGETTARMTIAPLLSDPVGSDVADDLDTERSIDDKPTSTIADDKAANTLAVQTLTCFAPENAGPPPQSCDEPQETKPKDVVDAQPLQTIDATPSAMSFDAPEKLAWPDATATRDRIANDAHEVVGEFVAPADDSADQATPDVTLTHDTKTAKIAGAKKHMPDGDAMDTPAVQSSIQSPSDLAVLLPPALKGGESKAATNVAPVSDAPADHSPPSADRSDVLVENLVPSTGNDNLQPHASGKSFATQLAHPQIPVDVTRGNHDRIVQVVRSELTPGGGSMKIRLDPPELGALQVTVKMSDGVMTASFETSTDQATKMLSHSLAQLKDTLESSGVSVEKLHVQQAPKSDAHDGNTGRDDSQRDQTRGSDDSSQQQRDQQRREMIRRMWAKLGVGDPLDLVA